METQCYKLPFLQAIDKCKTFGARLCTVEELLANEVTGTGCGFDASNVWSSSREIYVASITAKTNKKKSDDTLTVSPVSNTRLLSGTGWGASGSCSVGEFLVSAGAGYNAAPTPLGLGVPQCAPIDQAFALRCCGDEVPEPVVCLASSLACAELGWPKLLESDNFCPQSDDIGYDCTDE